MFLYCHLNDTLVDLMFISRSIKRSLFLCWIETKKHLKKMEHSKMCLFCNMIAIKPYIDYGNSWNVILIITTRHIITWEWLRNILLASYWREQRLVSRHGFVPRYRNNYFITQFTLIHAEMSNIYIITYSTYNKGFHYMKTENKKRLRKKLPKAWWRVNAIIKGFIYWFGTKSSFETALN